MKQDINKDPNGESGPREGGRAVRSARLLPSGRESPMSSAGLGGRQRGVRLIYDGNDGAGGCRSAAGRRSGRSADGRHVVRSATRPTAARAPAASPRTVGNAPRSAAGTAPACATGNPKRTAVACCTREGATSSPRFDQRVEPIARLTASTQNPEADARRAP